MRTPIRELIEQFAIEIAPADLPPRYNIAPTQPVAVIRLDPDRQRELTLMRWGLIPSWAQDPSIGNRMINARSETVATKPAFRSAFRRRRCLVPADGYYEWQAAGKRKIPYYITRRDGRPFAMAGLWDQWVPPQGEPILTCTILTTDANTATRHLHDRMPVILDRRGADQWLDPDSSPQALASLLCPAPSEQFRFYRVSPRVNRPDVDDPSCIAPVDEGTLF